MAAILAAFLFAVVAVPVLRRPAHAVNLVDRPGGRKNHDREVPLIGGLAMFLGFAVAMLMIEASLRPYASLIVGMGILLMVGVIDDLIDMSASAKLSAQVLVAILMVSWGEVQIHTLGDLVGVKPIEMGEWAIPFTVLCTVLLINAINMADGTDGLAGGLVAVALAMLLTAGILGGASRAFVGVAGVLMAAVIGFLCYNLRVPGRPCATAFMGDSGSMMLGFALAWLAVYLSQVEDVSIYPVSIAWILVLPVLDVLTLYIRRIMKGRSPFSADREHLHHVLLRSGFSVMVTVWVLILVMTIFGLIGMAGWRQGWPEWWLFLGLIPVFIGQYLCSIRAWRLMRYLKKR
ncbi:undecaprenyl/decaprenyl-phosphate alpha-N-acetylglucosaminyl 1-phosphate transferase [Wenzhouxiangella sp. XN201]|uniref:MraY family glycosyltransferase n=1 Tax=Wenzhouxiangella sp. XN201 TaxID=2710755 RepID=UPI0013CBBEC5|nr:MraY family glycosyltransferase [Wenzhouxiangella sp. XN201]NEZ04098.1 undecaprenyl/decaprenyl-phosphate alpha-N-acetylglucosaminyl 1-phosphate transferase [Wenzhouxiangella sp. XN201]